MPLRLDIKRQLSARSDRVKSVDIHPTEPWMLTALYNGRVNIWNYDTQTMIKTFEVTELPVRAAIFVQRKNWILTGSDDMLIRVFNYNTLEKVHQFEAHSDYIRAIALHPTQPLILTCSDDMSIKLWDWDKKWACTQVFEGHTHYVMSVIFNPKDPNTFASASLDRSIKVWQLGATQPNFTLQGHEKGVNCIDYFQGGEKPYLVSGADDRLVKIWDYQNKSCVQTLDGHTQNVCAVCFHPELPIILTGSEDGTVRIWHANTYRLENTLNYGMERVWTMAYRRGSNSIAIGYDDGAIIIKLGREEPAMSMDVSGKIIMAKHNEVTQANLAKLEGEVKDGEILALATKDIGSCEIYPQTLKHNPNGRFVVVCGDGEYIIHTALSFRNKSFGQALEFVWAADSNMYAVRESSSKVKIFNNFKETGTLKADFSAEGIFGGALLGVRGSNTLSFFDWETQRLIRRIDVEAKQVMWSEAGDMVSIISEESFFVLKYNAQAVADAVAANTEVDDEGYETAFDVAGEIQDTVKTGTWVGACFIFTNGSNRLCYFVGGEIVTVSHLDRPMYILGYLPGNGRVFLGDKDLNIVSYHLPLPVLEYQTAVMRGDFTAADAIMPSIPQDQRARVAHFLEKQGFKEQALVVSTDPEHKFELALNLSRLTDARDIAVTLDSEHKWKQLSEAAMRKSMFDLAEECLEHANDFSGQMLLFTASGKADRLSTLSERASNDGKNNIAFLALFLQGKVDECLEILIRTNRLPEAALFARTYIPSRVSEVVKMWKTDLAKTNPKAAARLADPAEYENLFPGLDEDLKAERYLRATNPHTRPAGDYPILVSQRQQPLAERVDEAGDIVLDGEPEARSAPAPAPAAPVSPKKAPEPEPEPAAEQEQEQEQEDDWGNSEPEAPAAAAAAAPASPKKEEDDELDLEGVEGIDPSELAEDEDLLND